MTEEQAKLIAHELTRGLNDREIDALIHEYEMKVVLATFKELHCAFLLAQRYALEGH
jgi:hypothetical protein